MLSLGEYIEARKDEGLTFAKNWHNILMCIGGTLIFFWKEHKLDHIAWGKTLNFILVFWHLLLASLDITLNRNRRLNG